MPKLNFFLRDGSTRVVDAAAGRSVMQTAIQAGIPGIIAECGGSAMCGTCHVYVDASFAEQLPPIDLVEEEILGSVPGERRSNSRLSCQILVTDALDGMEVHVADNSN